MPETGGHSENVLISMKENALSLQMCSQELPSTHVFPCVNKVSKVNEVCQLVQTPLVSGSAVVNGQ